MSVRMWIFTIASNVLGMVLFTWAIWPVPTSEGDGDRDAHWLDRSADKDPTE